MCNYTMDQHLTSEAAPLRQIGSGIGKSGAFTFKTLQFMDLRQSPLLHSSQRFIDWNIHVPISTKKDVFQTMFKKNSNKRMSPRRPRRTNKSWCQTVEFQYDSLKFNSSLKENIFPEKKWFTEALARITALKRLWLKLSRTSGWFLIEITCHFLSSQIQSPPIFFFFFWKMMDKGVLINLSVCVQLNAPIHQNQTALRTRCVLGLLSTHAAPSWLNRKFDVCRWHATAHIW